jgi:hypothetical protein
MAQRRSQLKLAMTIVDKWVAAASLGTLGRTLRLAGGLHGSDRSQMRRTVDCGENLETFAIAPLN